MLLRDGSSDPARLAMVVPAAAGAVAAAVLIVFTGLEGSMEARRQHTAGSAAAHHFQGWYAVGERAQKAPVSRQLAGKAHQRWLWTHEALSLLLLLLQVQV